MESEQPVLEEPECRHVLLGGTLPVLILPNGVFDLSLERHRECPVFALSHHGFDILERTGVPGPWPLALGDNFLSRSLLAVNQLLICISRGLFYYQIFLRIKPQPSLELLLRTAQEHSKKRSAAIETVTS